MSQGESSAADYDWETPAGSGEDEKPASKRQKKRENKQFVAQFEVDHVAKVRERAGERIGQLYHTDAGLRGHCAALLPDVREQLKRKLSERWWQTEDRDGPSDEFFDKQGRAYICKRVQEDGGYEVRYFITSENKSTRILPKESGIEHQRRLRELASEVRAA